MKTLWEKEKLLVVAFELEEPKIGISGKGLSHQTFQVIPQSGIDLNSLPDDKFLDSSKLKEFADDNFKFDKSGRKLSKRVENNVGKGEIARYEQFLLLPQCFQKACFPGASKGVILWEWVNPLKVNPLPHNPDL